MFYIVIAVIFLLAIIATAVAASYTHAIANTREKYRGGVVSWLWPVGITVVFLVVTGFFSATSVEARSVAVQTAFGKYVDTLGGGLHWIAPWSDTEEFDTTFQTVDLADNDDTRGGKVQVAFNGGGGGWVNATVRWATTEESVKGLWESYRSFKTATDSLVTQGAKDAINNAANDFTALEARSDQAAVAAKIRENLQPTLAAKGIVLDSVSILSIPLDDKTQGSLDAVVVATNNVEKAKQDEQRAIIDVRTAKARAESNSVSPALNQRYCLDIVNVWDVAKNGPLPATFDCGLGSQAEPLVTVPAR